MVKFITNNEMDRFPRTHSTETYSMSFDTSNGNRYTFSLALLFEFNEEVFDIYVDYDDVNPDENINMIGHTNISNTSRKDEFTKIIYTLSETDPDNMMENIDHYHDNFLEHNRDLIRSMARAAITKIEQPFSRDVEEFAYFINLFSKIAAEKIIETYYRKEKLRRLK